MLIITRGDHYSEYLYLNDPTALPQYNEDEQDLQVKSKLRDIGTFRTYSGLYNLLMPLRIIGGITGQEPLPFETWFYTTDGP